MVWANAGFCSTVDEMYPLKAAHRLDGDAAAAGAVEEVATGTSASRTPASRAMLAPKRSISPLTTISFLRKAPLLLTRLRCLTLPSFPGSRDSRSLSSGRASARPSRSVRSLFPGRRCRCRRGLVLETPDEAVTRETNEECFMRRLSRLEVRKASVTEASGRNVFAGSSGWIWPVMRWRRSVLADGFVFEGGGRGAYGSQPNYKRDETNDVSVLRREGDGPC